MARSPARGAAIVTRPAEFYEALWTRAPDAENASRWSFQEDLVTRALAWCGDLAGRTVLEIGPGLGHETRRLAERGARVVAIDLVAASLLQTRRNTEGSRVSMIQARAESLPLAAASVDVVFAQTVLMHLDLDGAAAEWTRVLRPGGRAIVLEPLAGNPLVGLYRRWLSPYRATDPRYITVRAVAIAAKEFVVERHEEHYLLAVLALMVPMGIRNVARNALSGLDRLLFRCRPLRRLAWMTLIELRRR